VAVKGRLIDRFQNASHQRLDELVFQTADGQRSHPALGLWDEHFSGGLGPPTTTTQRLLQGLQVLVEVLPIVVLGYMVDSNGLGAIQGQKCPSQIVLVEMMHKVTHRLRRLTLRGCEYPVQSGVSLEGSVCADPRSPCTLVHIPSGPWLHGRYPTSLLL